ncbi:MAG: hypothetical protein LH478_09695 [Chitinophagaceae bacterium]|nr:hypothetical protein [Chitinophagaceae bacterium]
MMIAILGLGFFVLVALLFVVYLFSKKKPNKTLKVGDYVMFKPKYKKLFPQVPTTHALVIEKIIRNEAVVVYMTLNAISKETMPLYVLARAS